MLLFKYIAIGYKTRNLKKNSPSMLNQGKQDKVQDL